MKHKPIGSLADDLEAVAARVCAATRDNPVAVWVSDHAEVYADVQDCYEAMTSPWLVGIYTMGMDTADIVDDLNEVRRERKRAGVLD